MNDWTFLCAICLHHLLILYKVIIWINSNKPKEPYRWSKMEVSSAVWFLNAQVLFTVHVFPCEKTRRSNSPANRAKSKAEWHLTVVFSDIICSNSFVLPLWRASHDWHAMTFHLKLVLYLLPLLRLHPHQTALLLALWQGSWPSLLANINTEVSLLDEWGLICWLKTCANDFHTGAKVHDYASNRYQLLIDVLLLFTRVNPIMLWIFLWDLC